MYVWVSILPRGREYGHGVLPGKDLVGVGYCLTAALFLAGPDHPNNGKKWYWYKTALIAPYLAAFFGGISPRLSWSRIPCQVSSVCRLERSVPSVSKR